MMRPALHALWHQMAALPVSGGLLLAGAVGPVALVAQGATAALLGHWTGLPAWWRWIHLAFPFAVAGAHLLALPPAFYLASFLASALVFWGVHRTRVPLFMSGAPVREAVTALLPREGARVIDIGAGLGGLCAHLSHRYPNAHIEGIEIAPVPWLIAWLRTRLLAPAVRMRIGDYAKLDLSDYDLAFAYLSPAAMPALWVQACAQMRPGTLLVSNSFPVPNVAPTEVVPMPEGRAPLFLYQLPR